MCVVAVVLSFQFLLNSSARRFCFLRQLHRHFHYDLKLGIDYPFYLVSCFVGSVGRALRFVRTVEEDNLKYAIVHATKSNRYFDSSCFMFEIIDECVVKVWRNGVDVTAVGMGFDFESDFREVSGAPEIGTVCRFLDVFNFEGTLHK